MSATLAAGRRKVEIPRPDKPLFPCGISKLELAQYYERIAPTMLEHIRRRPLNLERFPDGIDGQRIIQQHASAHFPDWIARTRVPARHDRTVEHVVANDAATLVYLAGQACITLHSWLSRSDRLERPDRLIVDLDPSDGKPAEVRSAARWFGEFLGELGLHAWAMTTGSRGYHVVVPLRRREGFEEVRSFARELAALAAIRKPRVFTIEQRKAKRAGRILIDVMRNAYAHTAVAPYSVRPKHGAPVATPLHWDELSERSMRADRFTLRDVPRRVEADGDPWRGFGRKAQTLGEARRRLEGLRQETGAARSRSGAVR